MTLVNPAIGGTTLSQNVILMPRWLQEAPSPDLVAIWFGGNDWDSGVRGDRYRQYLEMAVDRVRRATKGQAEVLVMTTCPGFAAWETRNELCRAAFEVARERKTGFVDAATAFHKAGSREEALKRQYWAWDNVHLGARRSRPDRRRGLAGHWQRRGGRSDRLGRRVLDEIGRRPASGQRRNAAFQLRARPG